MRAVREDLDDDEDVDDVDEDEETSKSADRVLLGWLAARAIPGVERVERGLSPHRPAERRPGDRSCARTVPSRRGRPAARRACSGSMRSPPRSVGLAPTRCCARSWPPGRPGVPGCFDGYELAVRAVLGQQVTVSAGRTLAARIAAEHGEPLADPGPGLTHLFPAPDALAQVDVGGMPASRARAIRALAAAVADGLAIEPGADVRDSLLALPGIGPWTVEYVAMRALRDPDALPAGDLVLRKASAGSVRRRSAGEPRPGGRTAPMRDAPLDRRGRQAVVFRAP